MGMAVEVVFGDAVRNLVPAGVVQHQTTDDRLLRLDGMRRHPDLAGTLVERRHLFGTACRHQFLDTGGRTTGVLTLRRR
jgi:hypothetical protein